MTAPNAITQLLTDWRAGRDGALDELAPLVYEELRRVAGRVFRSENPGHTLQPTAVVNEVFLKLVDSDIDVNNRVHFFSLAAGMMRRLLVDHAKSKRAAKRGGGERGDSLDEQRVSGPDHFDARTLDLDAALQRLADVDARKAQVLELHFFGGLTYEEMSALLGIGSSTLHRDLRAARAWLRSQLEADSPSPPET